MIRYHSFDSLSVALRSHENQEMFNYFVNFLQVICNMNEDISSLLFSIAWLIFNRHVSLAELTVVALGASQLVFLGC